jgi:hypothetical protein
MLSIGHRDVEPFVGVVKGAEQIRTARLELDLGGDVGERVLLADSARLARVHREAKTKVAYPLSSGVPKARKVVLFK